MQLTQPNEIRRPGVRLHPKACAALGLKAERATPKRLGTLVGRTYLHALGTGYARKSGEPLGFRPKEGRCASAGAHPPGETSTSRRRRSALRVLPGAAFVGGQQSGLAGCKPPPLFLPTYLPTYLWPRVCRHRGLALSVWRACTAGCCAPRGWWEVLPGGGGDLSPW